MRKRKTSLPAVILGLSLWLVLAGLVYFVNPELIKDIPVKESYGLFFGLVFLAVFLTAGLIWRNSRRGLLTAIVMVAFLVLRLIKLGHWLNLVLLIGVAIAIDSVFTKRV